MALTPQQVEGLKGRFAACIAAHKRDASSQAQAMVSYFVDCEVPYVYECMYDDGIEPSDENTDEAFVLLSEAERAAFGVTAKEYGKGL